MGTPLSIRFDEDLLLRLRRRAQGMPGVTISGLAQQFVEEGLRMAEHPGILFKDGPAGRRTAMHCYSAHPNEIDDWIAQADAEADAAYAAWEAEQRLLA